MPIIYQLVKTLTPKELAEISALPLQDRERDVLQVMIQLQTKVFPSSSVCKKLNLNTSHLDKINSLLFRKVIECLAGTIIFDQVHYLDQKNGMWYASLRLLKQHEQKQFLHLTERNDEAFTFYKFYFEWIMSIANAITKDGDVQHIAQKLLKHCPKATYDETQLWIKIVLFRKEINNSTTKASYSEPKVLEHLNSQLQDLMYEAEAIQSATCLYKAKLAGILLCNLTRNFTQSKVYISEINDLFSAYREAFSETEILIAQWHYGQILFFSSKFTESFEVYHGLYSRINIRETMRWYVFMAEYFQLCLVTGHYEIGEEICRDYFIKFFDDKNGSFYLSALIQCVKLLIHTNQFELAQQKLEELNKLTTKSSSLQFQFALRKLTVAYYYLSGNFKEALSLAEKNLKFMRSKRMHYLIPEYTYHARLTKAFVKRKLKNKPLTSEDELMFDAMQKGTMAQYGILLKKLADA